MKREKVLRTGWMLVVLTSSFLGLGMPQLSADPLQIHIIDKFDMNTTVAWLQDDFSVGLGGLSPGRDYEIRFVDVSGQVWGRFIVQAGPANEPGQTFRASWSISLRRILAGCETQEELEKQGIFWNESYRFPNFFTALAAVGGITFHIELYSAPANSFLAPLLSKDLTILDYDALTVGPGVFDPCYKDVFLAGVETWAEDVYLGIDGGSAFQSGEASTADVYVVTESDYLAGSAAWREVRRAHTDSPQQIVLPQGQEVVTFKLWDGSETVVGAYRVIVIPVASGKLNVDPGIEKNTTAVMLILNADLAGPETIAPSIWKCPSDPPSL
jgi:hypothetical protein